MAMTTRRIVLPAIICMTTILVNCRSDTGESSACDRKLDVAGNVAGTEVDFGNYDKQAVWFNSSVEEKALSSTDEKMMEWLGLDKTAQADVERYRYWLMSYDFRVILMENKSVGASPKIGKDFSVFFFDVERHGVQPGTPVDVFDLSPLRTAQSAGDRSAVGDTIRTLIDTMRDNGKADLIVGFAPDRSEENSLEALFINMFSRFTWFASSGTGTFFDLKKSDGTAVPTLTYPVDGVDAVSAKIDARFPNGSAGAEAVCFKMVISN